MNKHITKFFLLLFVALIVAQGLVGYYLYTELRQQRGTAKEALAELDDYKQSTLAELEEIANDANLAEIDNIRNIPKQPKSIEELNLSGWIPDWDIPNGFRSMQDHGGYESISPVWFWINDDGTLKDTAYMNDSEFIEYCKDNGIELIPTITLFNEDILSQVLATEDSRKAHIDEIMHNVLTYDYDGIDLDYESMYLKDKEKLLDLLEDLAIELKRHDKKLSFTVVAKWGNEVVYRTFTQTRMGQDYRRIGELVDEFRIMGYEYSGRDNQWVGPIAPIKWMEDTIQYAIYSGVPRDKIVLGIHTYAYSYSERDIMPTLDYVPVYGPASNKELEAATAHFPSDVEAIIENNNASISFNDEWGEAIAEYISPTSGQKRIMVFPNQQSIDLRKQLAADYGLKGVIYWRVGSEGSLNL